MRLFVLLISFALSTTAYAETAVTDTARACCIYQHFTMTTDLDGASVVDSTEAILEIGDATARYGDLSAYTGQRPAQLSSSRLVGDPYADDGFTVCQNFPTEGTVTVREALLPNTYLYEESLALTWEMTEGEENVLGYKCKKAKANYAGRTWLVCYATDIASTSGPWKLTGLPGLILKAESADGVHRFVATQLFDVKSQSIVPETNETYIAVKRDKFVKLRNRLKTNAEWAKNAAYYLNSNDYKSITIIKAGNKNGLAPRMNINGVSLPLSGGFGHRYQPLELE